MKLFLLFSRTKTKYLPFSPLSTQQTLFSSSLISIRMGWRTNTSTIFYLSSSTKLAFAFHIPLLSTPRIFTLMPLKSFLFQLTLVPHRESSTQGFLLALVLPRSSLIFFFKKMSIKVILARRSRRVGK